MTTEHLAFWSPDGSLSPWSDPNILHLPFEKQLAFATATPIEFSDSGAASLSIEHGRPERMVIEIAGREEEARSKRFYLAFTSLCIICFITSLDSIVTATALPKIAEEFNATSVASFWCATSFLLAQSATPPLSGIVSECIGRKICCMVALAIFLLASVFCATARSIWWLVAARTFQGIGAGGLHTSCSMILTDMVGIRQRAKYGTGFAIANALGLLSGVFVGSELSQNVSWRTIFWLNVPLCVVAGAGVQLFLNLKRMALPRLVLLKSVDWPGLVVLMTSTTILLIGVTTGGVTQPWTAPATLIYLSLGGTGLVSFVAIERWYAQKPLVPLRILANRTASFGYMTIFLHGFIVWGVSHYLVLYFIGAKSRHLTKAVYSTLPGIGTLVPFAAMSGSIMAKTKRFQKLTTVAWLLMMVGLHMMSTLQVVSGGLLQYGCQIVVSCGAGMIFPSQVVCVQAVQEDVDIPSATSFNTFLFTLGQAFGVAISGTVFQMRWASLLREKIRDLQNISAEFLVDGDEAASRMLRLQSFPPQYQQMYQVITADSLRTIWMMMTGLAFLGVLGAIMMEDVSLDRTSNSAQEFDFSRAGEQD